MKTLTFEIDDDVHRTLARIARDDPSQMGVVISDAITATLKLWHALRESDAGKVLVVQIGPGELAYCVSPLIDALGQNFVREVGDSN